ncbi:MAG: hypothetical protein QXH80_00725, partial [Candidatus Nanoarchaeia archaeon]
MTTAHHQRNLSRWPKTRKGVSAVVATLVTILILIFVMAIFFGFSRASFFQEKALLERGAEATGEIPCVRAPSVVMEPVTFINPAFDGAKIIYGLTEPVNISAEISSGCFENLLVTWTITEPSGSKTIIENECVFATSLGTYALYDNKTKEYTTENCTTISHKYRISPGNIWNSYPITVSAYGVRSGFFTEDSSNGFVNDPLFRLTAPSANVAGFSCVNLAVTVFSENPSSLTASDFEIVDNTKPRDVEQVSASGSNYNVIYRAPGGEGDHTVVLRASKGYQFTPPVNLTYRPTNLIEKQEISVFGNPGDLDVYDSSLNQIFTGKYFPDLDKMWVDFATGDINNDGVEEYIFIRKPGDIFVASYAILKSQLTKEFQDKIDDPKHSVEVLKQFWPYADIPNKDWKAVATGRNIASENGIGNIVTLGDPGELGLYKYSNGQIEELDSGGDFKNVEDKDNWRDITTVDLDDDGEDEIIAVRTPGDLYMFKYKKYKDVSEKQGLANIDFNQRAYWINLENLEWIAVAAGEMDGNKNTIEIAVLGKGDGDDGDLALYAYNRKTKDVSNLAPANKDWRDDWPDDVGWKDMAISDINRDGIGELAFLYDNGGTDLITVFNFTQIVKTQDYKNKYENLEKQQLASNALR